MRQTFALARLTHLQFLLLIGAEIFLATRSSFAQASATESGLQAQLIGVQKRLFAGGDYSAHFEQTYRDTLRDKSRHESGTLEVKKDGRLRFVYDPPHDKQFVFDGNTAFFSEPEAGQVTVFPAFGNTLAAQSMMILWGQASVKELFAAATCTDRCPAAEDGEKVVALTPKVVIPTVRKVALVIGDSEVRRACVYDPLGNVTEYRFSSINHDAQLSVTNFRFEIPKESSVLYAPSGDPKPKTRVKTRQPDLRARPDASLK